LQVTELTTQEMAELIERGLKDVPKIAAARRKLAAALREAKLGGQMQELKLLVRDPIVSE
jgi:hypothetical protein